MNDLLTTLPPRRDLGFRPDPYRATLRAGVFRALDDVAFARRELTQAIKGGAPAEHLHFLRIRLHGCICAFGAATWRTCKVPGGIA
jgi:hypothetical protein